MKLPLDRAQRLRAAMHAHRAYTRELVDPWDAKEAQILAQFDALNKALEDINEERDRADRIATDFHVTHVLPLLDEVIVEWLSKLARDAGFERILTQQQLKQDSGDDRTLIEVAPAATGWGGHKAKWWVAKEGADLCFRSQIPSGPDTSFSFTDTIKDYWDIPDPATLKREVFARVKLLIVDFQCAMATVAEREPVNQTEAP